MEYSSNFSNNWLAFLAVGGGMTLLVGGGELLVEGATRLAKRLGMSATLIGLTVVAFGTSMPELFVSLAATLGNHADLMVGNVVGSNIANIGLVLAISAIVAPIIIPFKSIGRELYLVLLVSLCVLGVGLVGTFLRAFGIIFITGLIAFTYLSYREANQAKKINGSTSPATPANALSKTIPFIVGGFLFLAFGSNLFIQGAVDLALYFGVSELVIGLTMAAVGTSLPELASSVSAARRGEAGLLVGNILGSNLFNLMLVMGATATIKPFAFPESVASRDLPIMLGFALVLWPILKFRQKILRRHGIFLLSAYTLYLWLLA